MNAPTPMARVEKPLLFACIALITFIGPCERRKGSDPSVHVEERRQRSVMEDSAVRGELPFDWLADNVVKADPPPDESEIAEFGEMFKNTRAPKILEAELSLGATRTVELQLAGPSGIAGSAQWVGTSKPLKVTLQVNGSTLGTGTTFSAGTKRGGVNVQAETPVGGRATLAVTNTTKAKVKVRILLLATAR